MGLADLGSLGVEPLVELVQDQVRGLELVDTGPGLMAADAVELVQQLPALDLRQALRLRDGQVLGGDGVGHQAEDEGHDRLAGLGLLALLADGVVVSDSSFLCRLRANLNCGMRSRSSQARRRL